MPSAAPATESAVDISSDGKTLKLSGRLDATTSTQAWQKIPDNFGKDCVVDGAGLEYCDSAGLALLFSLRTGRGAELRGLNPEIEKLLSPFDQTEFPKLEGGQPKKESFFVGLGIATTSFAKDVRDQLTFVGQITIALGAAVLQPHKIRWRDFWSTFEKAGTNAVGIVGMIGFLTGLIMAFQSSVPLRQFGVDIFVVNLVALSMLRELGVLMTAIVLAGRSGSAFAAEIGTMKVNEEVDALTTMGLDPIRFLVVPKVLAGILVMPFLTAFANLVGVLGGLLVVRLIGHPWAAIMNQLQASVSINDVMAGMIKSFFFGLLVAGVGCLRGLQTQFGATAVGDSTTRAVVSGIFLIVLADAIFAIVFYAIGF